MINIRYRKRGEGTRQFSPSNATMKPMQTPVRLGLLLLLGACTGTPTTPAEEEAPALLPATETAPAEPEWNDPPPQEPALSEPPLVPQPPLVAQTEAGAAELLNAGFVLEGRALLHRLMGQCLAELRLAEQPQPPAQLPEEVEETADETMGVEKEAVVDEATAAEPLPDLVRIAERRAELEWLMRQYLNTARPTGLGEDMRQQLAALDLQPRDGLAWARAQNVTSDSARRLGKLTRWQFVGPFDNERGAAMDQPLAAEGDPDPLATYVGKLRPISWRTLPSPGAADGMINFAYLLTPYRQSAVMMRTWVWSEQETQAHLLLGIAGEAQVWHEGSTVLIAKGEHRMALDALQAPLTLKAGWNELAIKLGSRERPARIQARLVEADSLLPLHLEQSATPPQDLLALELGTQVAEADDLAIGATGYYQAITMFAPEDAEAHFRLGTLRSLGRQGPKASHPGRDDLRRATELAPDSLRIRAGYARNLYPAKDDLAAEIDLTPWLLEAQKVLQQDPTHYPSNMQRLAVATEQRRIEVEAFAAWDALHEATPNSPLTLYLRAWMLEEFGYDELAHATRLQVLQHEDIEHWPNLYGGCAAETLSDSNPKRHEWLQREFEQTRDFPALLAVTEFERKQRSHFDAAAELAAVDRLLAERPWSSRVRRDSARRFLAEGDLETATRLVEDALRHKPEDAANLALSARLKMAAGEMASAVELLELEMEMDFGNEEERRLLDHLRALDSATFEAPYREPLSELLARHPATEGESSEHSHEYLLFRSVVHVHPDSTSSTYRRKVIRVLNPSGLRELDEVYFPFAWGDQELRVLRVEVHHADGRMETARTDRGWEASVVDVPELEVGDVIDLEWKVSDRRTTYFGQYFGLDHAMSPDPSRPTRESHLVLLVPEELPLKFHTIAMGGLEAEVETTEDFGTRHSWQVTGLMPQRIETLMPHPEETVARVQASSYGSWEDFGAWWWSLIEAEIRVSSEMREKVAELTDGLEGVRAQVEAVYDFVANDIRYNAWEFGVHGYQPYSAPVIFSRQFGDCKDKAILLRAMLSEVGIEAYPVLILRSADGRHGGRRHEEDLTLAMVNHFNHCIAYLPPQGDLPETWLDGTARLHPYTVLPYDDRGAQVLIVRPDGVERVRIPFDPAEVNRRAFHYTLRFANDGSAQVDLVLRPQGRWDPSARSTFAGGDQDRLEAVEQMMSSLLGPLQGSVTYDIQDVEQLDQPLVLLFGAEASRLGRVIEDRIEIPAMIEPLQLMQRVASEASRQSDLLLSTAHEREVTMDIILPEGWMLKELPPPVQLECPDARYSWSIERGEDGLRVLERFEQLTHRIPAERYDRFRDMCRQVDASQDRYLELVLAPVALPESPLEPVQEAVEEQP